GTMSQQRDESLHTDTIEDIRNDLAAVEQSQDHRPAPSDPVTKKPQRGNTVLETLPLAQDLAPPGELERLLWKLRQETAKGMSFFGIDVLEVAPNVFHVVWDAMRLRDWDPPAEPRFPDAPVSVFAGLLLGDSATLELRRLFGETLDQVIGLCRSKGT